MPISFPRQVLALTSCPELLNEPAVVAAMPQDVVERAQKYLSEIPAGTGAYSHSKGVVVVRREVADFIDERDGGHEDPNHFLTDGAAHRADGTEGTDCARTSGYYIPIPQYHTRQRRAWQRSRRWLLLGRELRLEYEGRSWRGP